LNKIIGFGVLTVVVLIIVMVLFGGFFAFIKIEGSELGVVQDWKGIKLQTLGAGTHLYNNFVEDVYVYPIGTQKITFDIKSGNPDAEYERIDVEVGENGGQKAAVAISCNYHLNPEDIVKLHKQGIGRTYESVVLKREIVDTVNEIARPYKSALDLYSGSGFVKFKNEIDQALKNNSVLKDRGIDVENTIIYGVHLDPAYEQEIAAKQIAQQQVLRKQEETKAAEQEAKRIFAFSQAEVEKARQVAEANKIVMVTAAEAQAQQQVLQAEGEKKKRILEAEGNRDANIALASGELAVGKARAEVKQLESISLYQGEAGLRRSQVDIAKLKAEAAKSIIGRVVTVMPEKTFASLSKDLIAVADITNSEV
jgi:regulator of protease activity HflC (stomatin/prohibitin superfamily)